MPKESHSSWNQLVWGSLHPHYLWFGRRVTLCWIQSLGLQAFTIHLVSSCQRRVALILLDFLVHEEDVQIPTKLKFPYIPISHCGNGVARWAPSTGLQMMVCLPRWQSTLLSLPPPGLKSLPNHTDHTHWGKGNPSLLAWGGEKWA